MLASGAAANTNDTNRIFYRMLVDDKLNMFDIETTFNIKNARCTRMNAYLKIESTSRLDQGEIDKVRHNACHPVVEVINGRTQKCGCGVEALCWWLVVLTRHSELVRRYEIVLSVPHKKQHALKALNHIVQL